MTKISFVLGLALCAFPAQALLADAGSPRSVTVSYADLDLTTAKGKKSLDRRIGRAIETVCGSYALAHEMVEIDRIDKCRATAKQGVEPQMANIRRKSEIRLSSATLRRERE